MSDVGLFKIAVSAVILNDKNEVLLTQRSFKRDHHPGEWETISGRLKNNETFEEGLRREIREEINIEVKIIQPFSTFHFFRGVEKEEHLGVNFLCRYSSGEIRVDGVEEINYQWLPIDEALRIVKDESILRSLREVMETFKPK